MTSEVPRDSSYEDATLAANTQSETIGRPKSPKPDYLSIIENSDISSSRNSDYVRVSDSDRSRNNLASEISSSRKSDYITISEVDKRENNMESEQEQPEYCDPTDIHIEVNRTLNARSFPQRGENTGNERPMQIVPPIMLDTKNTDTYQRIKDVETHDEPQKGGIMHQNSHVDEPNKNKRCFKVCTVIVIIIIIGLATAVGVLVNIVLENNRDEREPTTNKELTTFGQKTSITPDINTTTPAQSTTSTIPQTSTVKVPDKDECVVDRPCAHNCTNLAGGYKCACADGYTLATDGKACNDKDECATRTSLCDPGSTTCSNKAGSYDCNCKPGYTRQSSVTSCDDINECSSSPCPANSNCENTVGSYVCNCIFGYRKDTQTNTCVESTANEELTTFGRKTSITSDINPTTSVQPTSTSTIPPTSTVKVPGYPKDCKEIRDLNIKITSVYTIYPFSRDQAVNVMCDMTREDGGWTVFQRRFDGSVDFYRVWKSYKTGFGSVTGEHWLGNDVLHQLTALGESFLYVVLEDFDGKEYVAEYSNFTVADESDQYRFWISEFMGGNAMNAIEGWEANNVNGMQFSTYDRDNDKAIGSCAVARHGAWWYNECTMTNLNGRYPVDGGVCGDCNFWFRIFENFIGLKKTMMMVRRK